MRYDFDKVTERRGTNSVKWSGGENELPMWVADMDFQTAPAIVDAIMKRAEHGIFGYSVIPDEWYTAYIGWWKTRHGVEFRKSEMMFSSGVVPTLACCIKAFTEPNDKVLILSPVYYVFYKLIEQNGRRVLDCPLSESGGVYSIDRERLEAAMSDHDTKLMLLSDPHNPVGKIWSREELAEIGELADRYGVTVVSDEIHCDLTDPDVSYVPYYSASELCAENGIVCVSPTKTFNLAGLQSSAVIVRNEELRKAVSRALTIDNCAYPNAFAVQAAVAAFEQGGEWLDELREYICSNRNLVSDYLSRNIPEIKLTPSAATYLLWLDCRELGVSSKKLTQHIRSSTGLYLTDGGPFGGEGFLRMNIACPKTLLRDGLERLKKGVESIPRP